MSAVLSVCNLFRGKGAGIPLASRRFDREWDRFQPRSSQGIQGCWTGKWKSFDTRKESIVKCILTRIAPATYFGSFSSKYLDFFNMAYEVQFRVIENRNEYHFEGAADLGRLAGGVHHFKGIGTPTALVWQYRSAKDEGEIQFHRAA